MPTPNESSPIAVSVMYMCDTHTQRKTSSVSFCAALSLCFSFGLCVEPKRGSEGDSVTASSHHTAVSNVWTLEVSFGSGVKKTLDSRAVGSLHVVRCCKDAAKKCFMNPGEQRASYNTKCVFI